MLAHAMNTAHLVRNGNASLYRPGKKLSLHRMKNAMSRDAAAPTAQGSNSARHSFFMRAFTNAPRSATKTHERFRTKPRSADFQSAVSQRFQPASLRMS